MISERQSTRFDFRLAPRIRAILEDLAEMNGLSEAGYLRMLILKESTKSGN